LPKKGQFISDDQFLQEEQFRKTIDIDPNWTWGYIKLGRTLALAGKRRESILTDCDLRAPHRRRRGAAVAHQA
jgi:hypothetical protein